MHAKSNNIEIMIGSETDEAIKELFESFLKRYQKGLEESMKGSEFFFDGVNALYYDFNKISLNRGKSYIDSPEWLKNKKATINPKNNDDKCFQYGLTVALMKVIQKQYQRLNPLMISIIGIRLIFHHIVKAGKSLNQIINQLLLIICMYPIILKK